MKRTAIVIAAYNEADNIAHVVSRAREYGDVIVVDDASRDDTAAIAQTAGAQVVRHAVNTHIRQAFVDGFRHALANGYERIVQMDAGLSHDPGQIPRLVEPLDRVDMTIGSRFVPRGRLLNQPMHRKWLSRVGSFLLCWATSMRILDLTSGFKGYRAGTLRAVDAAGGVDALRSRAFAFQFEMTYIIFAMDLSILEVPISYAATGSSLNWAVFCEAVRMLLHVACRRNSMKRVRSRQGVTRRGPARSVARQRPLVSVIMAVYNGRRYLREAIDSVLAQTFQDFELIVVDDGSTDATPRILARYKDPRLRVIRQENAGRAVARNRALDEAQGEYIAINDADDVSLPSRLEEQMEFLGHHPEIALLGAHAMMVDEKDRPIWPVIHPVEHKKIRETLASHMAFVHPTVVFRKSVIPDCGGYRAEFPLAQDYDLALRITERFRCANIGKPLLRYRIHPASATVRKVALQTFYSRLARELAEERTRRGKDRLQEGRPLLTGKDEQELTRLLTSREDRTEGFVRWGRIQQTKGRRLSAAAYFLRAIRIDPLTGEHYRRLARLLVGKRPVARLDSFIAAIRKRAGRGSEGWRV